MDYETIKLHSVSTGIGFYAISTASWFARAVHLGSPSDVDAFIFMVRGDIMALTDGTNFVFSLDGRELPGTWVAYPNNYKNMDQPRPFIAPYGYQSGDGGVRFLVGSPDESSITGNFRKLTNGVRNAKDNIIGVVHMDPVNAIGKFVDDTTNGN
jgi:hypothetical protein